MTLTKYSREWIKSRGLSDKDSDYGGMSGKALMRMVILFSKEDHSGMSGSWIRQLFNYLMDDYEEGVSPTLKIKKY